MNGKLVFLANIYIYNINIIQQYLKKKTIAKNVRLINDKFSTCSLYVSKLLIMLSSKSLSSERDPFVWAFERVTLIGYKVLEKVSRARVFVIRLT